MIEISPSHFDDVLAWICKIQQIPAPTFNEEIRANFMFEEFKRLGFLHIEHDSSGNVLARWPGGEGKPLVVSAHLDTVHQDQNPLPLERTETHITGPGVADNSTGLAALLSMGHYLIETRHEYPGDIWLAANVCEEGLGNLAGMRALVDRFGGDVQAYLILEGLGLGQVCHRGLGVTRLRISAETHGGHSWVDYGTPSAIHELARVAVKLADLSLPAKPRTSLNIGIIEGGTSINTIASKAHFLLDLRSEDQSTLSRVRDRVRQIVSSYDSKGVNFTVDQIGERPAGELPAGHPLVRLALEVLSQLATPSALEIGSTDANIPLSECYPAICIGLTRGSFPHTAQENIEIEPLKTGLTQLHLLMERVWGIPM